jgi:hypothetical protein
MCMNLAACKAGHMVYLQHSAQYGSQTSRRASTARCRPSCKVRPCAWRHILETTFIFTLHVVRAEEAQQTRNETFLKAKIVHRDSAIAPVYGKVMF